MSGDSVYRQENNLASISEPGYRVVGVMRVVTGERHRRTTTHCGTMQHSPGREHLPFGTANAGDEFRGNSDGHSRDGNNRYPWRLDHDTQKRWPDLEQYGQRTGGNCTVLDRGPGLFIPVAHGDLHSRVHYEWNEHYDG